MHRLVHDDDGVGGNLQDILCPLVNHELQVVS